MWAVLDHSAPLGLHFLIVVSGDLSCRLTAFGACCWLLCNLNALAIGNDTKADLTSLLLVTAIIFLAPISSFDEWLAEDPTINRLVRD